MPTRTRAKFPYYNPKSKRLEKLSRAEQEGLVFDLINAFASVKTPLSASLLIQDLLTASEIKNLSKRLRIAKLLLKEKSQVEIVARLHCSFATIAKVRARAWLDESGTGLRTVLKNLPERKEKYKLLKGYYGYGLPQIALTALLNSLEKKERHQLETFIKKVADKEVLRRKIQELVDEEFTDKAKTKPTHLSN